ncbi:MAG: PilZ domain-containing protein [Candidatus Sulfotelmatobacter sp.]
MLNKRTSPRRKMVLPVKVTLDKVNHLAHTVDIARTGARLGGFRTQLQPGMMITLQRGSKKAQFRITWIRQLGPNELQAGVESLELLENFWGVDLSDQEHKAKEEAKTFMAFLSG